MPDNVFFHHVNEHKNDFAAWAYHSVGDEKLAELLGPEKTKAKNLLAVKTRVRQIISERVFKKGEDDF